MILNMNFLRRKILYILLIIATLIDFHLFTSIGVFQGIQIFPMTGLEGILMSYPWIVGAIILLECIGLGIVVKILYIRPVQQLRREIAQFLAGSKNSQTLSGSWWSPDIDYVTNFFNKSLEILRKFKEEFRAGKMLQSEVEIAAEIQK